LGLIKVKYIAVWKMYCKLPKLNCPAMTVLILSGGSYGANWLPLLLPLAAIILIYKGVDASLQLVRKRKLHCADRQMGEFTQSPGDEGIDSVGQQ
jgi:hypothetical protein